MKKPPTTSDASTMLRKELTDALARVRKYRENVKAELERRKKQAGK